jgi:hypothetical protein
MKLSIEILNDYPLATEAIRDWFMKRMEQSLQEDNVAEDFKNEILRRGIPDHTLAIMLDQSPRNFFDVLDENGIYVTINYEIKRDAKKIFTYQVNHVAFLNYEFENRVSCEKAAVIMALKTLDGK